MIIEYQRPASISEAVQLLKREKPVTFPLGGGTVLNRGSEREIAVVDLQALPLGKISIAGNQIHIGATTTLQQILDIKELPGDFSDAIKQETGSNLRQMATIAGTLVTATGRSPLATVVLAMDASLELLSWEESYSTVKLGDWLPLRDTGRPNQLITDVLIPINIKVAFEMIARSPADQPIVCASVAAWPLGRTRLTLGGWGKAPILGMDGPEAGGIETAARDAYSQAGDEWASAEYRQEMAGILAGRCLQRVSE